MPKIPLDQQCASVLTLKYKETFENACPVIVNEVRQSYKLSIIYEIAAVLYKSL